MESNTMTDTELIEKCKKIIDGMGRYAYEQIQLSDLLTRFEKAQKENEQLKKALQHIDEWKFPETGKFWDDDETQPMSYAACYGSNGERDYMRQVARNALFRFTFPNPPKPTT